MPDITNNQINNAIMRVEGWEFHPSVDVNNEAVPEYWHRDDDILYEPINFACDYNAIIGALRRLEDDVIVIVSHNLAASGMFHMTDVLTATPRQLCEAYLRTHNNWPPK